LRPSYAIQFETQIESGKRSNSFRLASLIHPTLSTVRVDKGRLGRAMGRMLLGRIQNHSARDPEEEIRPELVIRPQRSTFFGRG
jgi:DNA-binding LacI/PurR family transcriptional regulator